jgi:ketosteroid isomerase-like protein
MQLRRGVYAAADHGIKRQFPFKRGPLRLYCPIVLLATVFLIPVACAPVEHGEQDDLTGQIEAARIADLRELWVGASNTGDLQAMKSFYAADAFIAPPDVVPVGGKVAIEKWIDSRPEDYPFELVTESLEIVVAGDWAFDRGTYALYAPPRDLTTPLAESGSYLRIWKKQAGTWKIHRDIWNRMPEIQLGPEVEHLPK